MSIKKNNIMLIDHLLNAGDTKMLNAIIGCYRDSWENDPAESHNKFYWKAGTQLRTQLGACTDYLIVCNKKEKSTIIWNPNPYGWTVEDFIHRSRILINYGFKAPYM